MKKDQNYPKKNIHSNNSSGKPLPGNYNISRQKSLYKYNYRGRSPDRRNSRNSHRKDIVDQTVKTIHIKIIIQDQIQI